MSARCHQFAIGSMLKVRYRPLVIGQTSVIEYRRDVTNYILVRHQNGDIGTVTLLPLEIEISARSSIKY